MIKIVEMTLAFSKNLPDTLLYLLLTDPLTGELFKVGVIERKILAYAEVDYDKVIHPDYMVNQKYTYSIYYALNGDYLFFNHIKTESFNTITGYDHYKVRINWITDQTIILGAYPNGLSHQAVAPNPLIDYIYTMPTLTGCVGFSRKGNSISLIDHYFNVGVYYPRYLDKFQDLSAIDCVASAEGLSLIYTSAYGILPQSTGAYLDPTPVKIGYKNGATFTLSEKQVYRGEVPRSSNVNDINLTLEYAIKQNTPHYIAKLTSSGKHIIQSITNKECYLYRNGGNPTGWDRNIRYFHDDTSTDINTYNGLAPDVKELYPEFNLTTLALSSYQLYYTLNKGFWKDHRYTEEINND